MKTRRFVESVLEQHGYYQKSLIGFATDEQSTIQSHLSYFNNAGLFRPEEAEDVVSYEEHHAEAAERIIFWMKKGKHPIMLDKQDYVFSHEIEDIVKLSGIPAGGFYPNV